MDTEMSMTVVVPTHSERRWTSLTRTLASVRAQTVRPAATIVVVDHNEELAARVRAAFPDVTVLANHYERGASGARNTGAEQADTEFVAFLDDDTAASDTWVAGMAEVFADPEVVGAGGGIVGDWSGPRPRWLPEEFLWTVGISYRGMPDRTARVRNVWSANMVVRRAAFAAVGGFRNGFGKRGDENRPEDTDLCLRMRGHWMYVPGAVISHEVPADRTTPRFFLQRCYGEGRGKVQMARLLRDTPADTFGAERDYLRRTVPRAIGRGLLDTARGRGLAPGLRAGASVAAVAAAGLGVVVQTVADRRRTVRVPVSVSA